MSRKVVLEIDTIRQIYYNYFRRVIEMKRMKYLITIFLLLISFSRVYALEVSKNDLTIERGKNDTVELYANVEKEVVSVTFTLVYSTYDIPANYAPASGVSDANPNGIRHELTFTEAKSGKILLGNININVVGNPKDTVGSVNIHTASAKDSNGEIISLNAQNINVRVGTQVEEPKEEPKREEPKVIDKNMLEKIESELVNIKLKENVFDYEVSIKDDVLELDLKPIAKDEGTSIDISSQKISELENNTIVITTKNGDTEQKYNIKVNIKDKDEIIVDKTEFEDDKSYKGKWIVISIVLIVALIISMLFSRKK